MGQQYATIVGHPAAQTPGPLRSGAASGGDNGALMPLPKLRELREDVFFRAEYLYLQNLIALTGRNIRKACELSGLSRSRLYTLLKKYQITQPLDSRCPQR